MYSYGTFCFFTNVQEASHYSVTWCASIYEEQVVVLKPTICETLRLVNLFVESYDCRYVVLPEIWEIGLGRMERVSYNKQGKNVWMFTYNLYKMASHANGNCEKH